MAGQDRTLVISLEAKLDKLEKTVDRGLAAVTRRMESTEKKSTAAFARIDAAAGRFASTLKRLAAGYLSIQGVQALGGFIKRSLDAAAAIGDLANQSNASIKYVQQFRYALAQAGGDAETADDALLKFNKNLGEFRTSGAGPAKQTFEQLGLATRFMNGEFAKTDDALDATLKALMQVPSAADRAAMAADLFGKSAGPQLAEILSSGSQALDDVFKKAEDLGLVLSDDLVKGAKDAGDKLETLETIISTKLTQAVVEFAPEIDALVQSFIDAAPEILAVTKELLKFLGVITRAPAEAASIQLKTYMLQLNRLQRMKAGVEPSRGPLGYLFEPALIGLDVDAKIAELEAKIKPLQDLINETNKAATDLFLNGGEDGWDGTVTVTGHRPRHRGANAAGAAALAAANKRAADEALRLQDAYEKAGVSLSRLLDQDIAGRTSDLLASGADKAGAVLDAITETANEQRQAFTDALVYAFQSGDLKGAALSFIGFFTERMYRDLANSIYDALFDGAGSFKGSGGGGIFGTIIGAIAGAFGGGGGSGLQSGFLSGFGRAGGGPVIRGQPYVVGERGRELFIPNTPGQIVSSDRMGGSSYTFAPVINASGLSVGELARVVDDQRRRFESWASNEGKRARGYIADARLNGTAGSRWGR